MLSGNRSLSSLNPFATIYLQDTKQNAKSQQKVRKVKKSKGKGNESTQRDCSTFRDFLRFLDTCHMPCPSTSRAELIQTLLLLLQIHGIGCCFPDISSRVKVSQPRAGTPSRKRRPPKGPSKPRDLLVGDSFYHRCLFVHFSTFRDFSTCRKKLGEQVDLATTAKATAPISPSIWGSFFLSNPPSRSNRPEKHDRWMPPGVGPVGAISNPSQLHWNQGSMKNPI